MAYWWLSFADGKRPEGEHFLSVAIVDSTGFLPAVMKTHDLKINPGGSCKGIEIPTTMTVPEEFQNRLITRRQVDEVAKFLGSETIQWPTE